MSYQPHNIPKIFFTISSCKKATQEGELDEEEDTYNCQKPYKKWDSWVDVETQRPTHSRCFYSRTQMSFSMQSSYSKKIATEMEQRTGPGVGEKTTDKTQTHSLVKEDQEPSEMISAPQDSAQSDSDATNGKRRKETQNPSSEIDNGGWRNSDEKLGRISPSLPTRAEHETKNNSAGDHHTQEEEQQEEEEEEEKGRERLKRHQVEVAGQVWIPEIWGQEELLKDWVDCSVFEASLVPAKIFLAKAALAEEGRKANSGGLRIDNSC